MSHVTSSATQALAYSEFAEDPDFRELLEQFCREVFSRGITMQSLLEHHELRQLEVLAHQLKGAAGGYGFPELSDYAARLEAACQGGRLEVIETALAATLAYIARVSL